MLPLPCPYDCCSARIASLPVDFSAGLLWGAVGRKRRTQPLAITRGNGRAAVPSVSAAPLRGPDDYFVESKVYVAPGGAFVYAAKLDDGWNLLTEEDCDGRDYVVQSNGLVEVKWQSDGWSAPLASVIEDFEKTGHDIIRCEGCHRWTVPDHDCDHRVREGKWWRVGPPIKGRARPPTGEHRAPTGS